MTFKTVLRVGHTAHQLAKPERNVMETRAHTHTLTHKNGSRIGLSRVVGGMAVKLGQTDVLICVANVIFSSQPYTYANNI